MCPPGRTARVSRRCVGTCAVSQSQLLPPIRQLVVGAVDVVVGPAEDAVPAAVVEHPLFRVFRCLFRPRDISHRIRASFRQTAAALYRPVALVAAVVGSVEVAGASVVPRRLSDLATTPWR